MATGLRIARMVVIIAAFFIFMWAYWHATIPGYFKGVTLCSEGCHTTKVLTPKNITYPFWCIGCHGFGVKSEILPGIPLYRDHKLELMVEEHGECLMCHVLPGEFHEKHIEAGPEDLRKVGLSRPVQCTDCHVNAYHGHHTELPRDKVCIKCHEPQKLHPDMVKGLREACTLCHSDRPVVPHERLKANATNYGSVLLAAKLLADKIGMTEKVRGFQCLICHVEPSNEGHAKHVFKKIRETGKLVTCIDCHKEDVLHGMLPTVEICTECHKPEKTAFHEEEKPLSDCFRCHRGFKLPNVTLMPVKGCEGCHGASYYIIVDVGLHASHIKAYKFNCSVCHATNVTTHKLFIKSAGKVEVCKRCHTKEAGLKPEAVQALAPGYGVFTGIGYEHAVLVEKAKGDCFKCHYEWFVVGKPKVVYFYGGGER